MKNQAKRLAGERLERDIIGAIREAAALHAAHTDNGKNRLDFVLAAEGRIADQVVRALARNWTVTERARGERVAT